MVATHPLAELLTPTEPAPVPSAVGQNEIDQLIAAMRMFQSWDNLHGGLSVREAVTAQLRYSAKLLNARCPDKLQPGHARGPRNCRSFSDDRYVSELDLS